MKSKLTFAAYSVIVLGMASLSIFNALLLQAFAVPLHMAQAHNLADALDLATCEILNIAHSTFDYAEARVKNLPPLGPQAEMHQFAVSYFGPNHEHIQTNVVTEHCEDCAKWLDPKQVSKKVAPNVYAEQIDGVMA